VTAGGGHYTRTDDGTWTYTATGEPVPGARDLTLTDCYPHLRVQGGYVQVPARLVAADYESLGWVLDHLTAPQNAGRRARLETDAAHVREDNEPILVPVAEWDTRAREPLGVLAPELAPGRLLTIEQVAELAGLRRETIDRYRVRAVMPEPVATVAGSPVWSRPVIDWWLATRRRPGRPRVE